MPKEFPTTKPPKYRAFEDRSVDNYYCIELQEGPYAGTVFHYHSIEFGSENEDGTATLNFNYTVVRGLDENQHNDFELQNTIAGILLEVITNAVDGDGINIHADKESVQLEDKL